MADELRIGLSELLRKAMIDQDAGFLKEGVGVLSQALMEMEVEARDATSAVLGTPDSATATASAPGTRGWGRWS
jgi:hypothetical protein